MEQDFKTVEKPRPIGENKIINDVKSAGPPRLDNDIKMLEDNKSIDDGDIKKPSKKSPLKIILLILIVLILIGSAAGAAYWWRDKSALEAADKQAAEISALETEKADLEKLLAAAESGDALVTDVTTPTVCSAIAPTATVIESIKASITSGNTAALAGYMASSVNVILAATEGVGPSTPAAAVTNITNFITTTNTAWDYNFALPAATLATYSAGEYKQYFPSIAVIGKATNGKVISFSFDCVGKISTVFMAASGELL